MAKIHGITAISFDGDGTLWDFDKVMRHSLRRALGELRRLDADAAAGLNIDRMIQIRNRVALKLKERITNLEAIRLEAFRQTLRDVGKADDDLASHLNQVYLKHRFENVELFDDVLPALEALRTNYIVGLLSNGNTYPECCGLDDMFRFVVFSQDHGIEKPDPRIFQIALKKAGCTERQLLHVGDSLENDVAGASGAGVKSVWLNRDRAENSANISPDHEISSLSELLDLV